MSLTASQRETIEGVIHTLSETRAQLEQKADRHKDVKLSKQIGALVEAGGSLSTVLGDKPAPEAEPETPATATAATTGKKETEAAPTKPADKEESKPSK